MSLELMQALAAELGATVSTGKKAVTLDVRPDQVPAACARVAAMPGLYHLSTITAMDTGESIALLYHFWLGKTFYVVRTSVPKSHPVIASIISSIPAATLYEAEVHDLLGVKFEGNPFMKSKLLLPDEYPKDAPPPLWKEADPAKIRKMMGLE